MPVSDRCPRCGALVLPEEKYCKQCGAELQPGAVEPPVGRDPRTIEELRAFCAYNGMPLERMRFFVGENCREARAFGIYRDGDRFVVYKNKADGSRAVRYQGPDQARAVKELYDKLLDECHKRDIWPGGKPPEVARQQQRAQRRRSIAIVAFIALFAALYIWTLINDHRMHRYDGYYSFDEPGVYYRYGDDWYYDDGYSDWYLVSAFAYDGYEDYGDYYLGEDYDAGWGVENFRSSDAWERIQEESRTSSSDYDSWDSGDTDWDSDW